ncbi:MAG: hypothetical protein ACKVOR_08065 [Flavobacteriales bacterium]
MLKKLTTYAIAACLATISAQGLHAQQSTHATLAAVLCQEQKMNEALAEIELATKDKAEQKDVYTWYVRGYIYKEHYKLSGDEMHRNLAVESFVKSKAMAGNDDEVTMNHKAALTYLATTYYNDALREATNLQNVNDTLCDHYLHRYHDVMTEAGNNNNLDEQDANYYEAKAQRTTDLWLISKHDEVLYNKCMLWYEKALQLKPGDCTLLHNLVVVQYNKLATHEEQKIWSADLSEELELAHHRINEAKKNCADSELLNAISVVELFYEVLEANKPADNKH